MVDDSTSIYLPKINNVKARFKVHSSEIDLLKKSVIAFGVTVAKLESVEEDNIKKKRKKVKPAFRQLHNFTVIRGKNTYMIWNKNGVVNITGIKCLCHLSEAVSDFCLLFGVNEKIISQPIIDNLTATGNFNRSINLLRLQEIIRKDEIITSINSVIYNPSYFPGTFCRTNSSTTCIVFPKGVYNVVGAKCRTDIQEIMKEMSALILRL